MRHRCTAGWMAACLAIALLLQGATVLAHDLNPADYRGDPLSAYFHWLQADPDQPGSGVLPEPEYAWVDDTDPDTWFWDSPPELLRQSDSGPGEWLHLDLPNFVDELPLKLMRVQLTWTGLSLGATGIPQFPEIVGIGGVDGGSGQAVTGQVDFSSPIQPFTQPDGGYQYHDLSIRPNPDWESITIFVPEGLVIDQIVVDSISTVPEPSALVLTLLAVGGAAGMIAVRRRRSKGAV